jgi:two-component sensor histidine kinase
MSIATVQQQLDPIAHGEDIAVAEYLTALCRSLSRSMIGTRRPISIQVEADGGAVSSDIAVSFGLITTELVINAIKHAFPDNREGTIVVGYSKTGPDWTLSVRDDGVGIGEFKEGDRRGLGTSIIGALANQLHAIIRKETSPDGGTTVSIIHSAI